MKVAVIGANGQLGTDLSLEFVENGYDVFNINHDDLKVEDIDSVYHLLNNLKPDIILNTAAYHVLDSCEKNPDIAFRVNSVGALNIALVAEDINAKNIYYSTDYVFDGKKNKPYLESDLTNPLNVYGVSKLSGEYITLNYSKFAYVLRVSGLYGKVPCRAKGSNFITTMVRLAKDKDVVKVVTDETLTPTSTAEIARNTLILLTTDSYGLFHFTAEESCTWYEFAKSIFEILNLKTPLVEAKNSQFPTTIARPKYSVLENYKYNRLKKRSFNHWRKSLVEFLMESYY